jgi:hypothetical protein
MFVNATATRVQQIIKGRKTLPVTQLLYQLSVPKQVMIAKHLQRQSELTSSLEL